MKFLRYLFLFGLFIHGVSSVQHADAQRALTFLTPTPSADNIANVYILSGQSNMTGKAPSTGLSATYLGAQNAYIYSTYGSGTNTRNASTQSWQRLELDKTNNNEGINGVADLGLFGPEMSFGKAMSDVKPNRIFIIKVAYSSSTLLGQGSVNDWMIGGPGTNYANLVQNSVINGLNEIVSDFGLTPVIRGFIWMQGEAERDGASGYATAISLENGWTLQFTRLLQYLVDDIVEAGYSTKSMRVCVGRIHNHFSPLPSPTMLTAVRRAQSVDLQNFITNNPGYAQYVRAMIFVDTDSFGVQADNTHYNQSGELALGQAYADYFLPYINETVTITLANTTGFDSDAVAFISAAAFTSSQQGLADCINSIVLSLKSGPLWSGIPAFYPQLGGNRKAHKLNLKDPSNGLGYNATFNTGLIHTSDGFNGFSNATVTQGYADTHVPLNSLGQNTAGLFYYTPTTPREGFYGMGAVASGNASRLYLMPNFTDGKWYSADMGAEATGSTNTDGSGTYILSRTSSSNYNVYIRGVKTSISSTSSAPDATTITIGARNVNGTKGSYSTKTWGAFGVISVSLSDADEASLRSVLLTIQRARQNKLAYWDAITRISDLGHGPLTIDGQGGFFKETTNTTLCENGEEIKGIRSFGINKTSTHNLPYAGNTSLTPANAKVWFKDLTTTNIGPRYIDNGGWDKYADIYNGPANVAYYETAGSFTTKTEPLDFITFLWYSPQTPDEGVNRVKALNPPATQKLSAIDGWAPDIVLADGNNYIPYQNNVARILVRADNTWQVWVNGVSKGTGTGVGFSTTEWIWGTNSHALGVHLQANIAKFGEFTSDEINTIYTNAQLIWPWATDPKFPFIKEIHYGDATTFDTSTKTWTPGRGKTTSFVGGTGTEGSTTYAWYYYSTTDATRFPIASPIDNHVQIPASINISTIASGNSVTQISIDGFNLMSGSVSYVTSASATADAVVSNVNAFQSRFVATRTSTATILFYPNGTGSNNYAANDITSTTSGFTDTELDAPRGASLNRTTYAVAGQIFDGHEGDNTINIMRVTYPIDNIGTPGPPQASDYIRDNIP
jgi:hypothetical protein